MENRDFPPSDTSTEMIKGTRILEGDEAQEFIALTDSFRQMCRQVGFSEIILSALSEQDPFIQKAGPEILNQMWSFDDKGNRPVCLIPEATAVVQGLYKSEWKARKKPIKVFYLTRCYRYEKPQMGRYRELDALWPRWGVPWVGGAGA